MAESEDVPGLVAEADSPNVLAQKLRTLIPELLELNGVSNDRSASFHVQYQHEDIKTTDGGESWNDTGLHQVTVGVLNALATFGAREN